MAFRITATFFAAALVAGCGGGDAHVYFPEEGDTAAPVEIIDTKPLPVEQEPEPTPGEVSPQPEPTPTPKPEVGDNGECRQPGRSHVWLCK